MSGLAIHEGCYGKGTPGYRDEIGQPENFLIKNIPYLAFCFPSESHTKLVTALKALEVSNVDLGDHWIYPLSLKFDEVDSSGS